MSEYKISEIIIYPVKSLPGISLKNSIVEERGLKYDRRWMLIDEENKFVTQRSFPQMVFFTVQILNNELIISHKKKNIGELRISLDNIPEKDINVEVWDDICDANQYKSEVNEWFSEAIDSPCKLVYMPNSSNRKTNTKYHNESKSVSFADGYPFLILGEESVNHLNSKLNKPASMEQFRPNIVFSGGVEHDEDNWNNIKIGELNYTVVKPCARCVIVSIDTLSATKNKEPLVTLSKYRNINNKIMFGQNAICNNSGTISIGDIITIE